MTPRRDDVSDGRDAPDGVASPSLDDSARVSVATSTARGSGARASCPARRVMRCRAKGASPDATRGREKLGGFSSFVMSLSFVSFAVVVFSSTPLPRAPLRYARPGRASRVKNPTFGLKYVLSKT
jgi:hypothetical protein